MKHLTEAMESLQVVFFSMVARTFPASSLNSSTAPMALPLSSNAYQLYLSYYILFHIYLLFYQKFSVFTCYCMLKWSAETSGLYFFIIAVTATTWFTEHIKASVVQNVAVHGPNVAFLQLERCYSGHGVGALQVQI